MATNMTELSNITNSEGKKKYFEIFNKVDLLNMAAYSAMAVGKLHTKFRHILRSSKGPLKIINPVISGTNLLHFAKLACSVLVRYPTDVCIRLLRFVPVPGFLLTFLQARV